MSNPLQSLRDTLDRELLHIEDHPDLTPDQKVMRVIQAGSTVAAVVAIQPVPMADFALQLPVLGAMGYKIGRIRGVDIREHDATRLVGEILATVGMGFASRQVVIGLYKSAFPFLGAITTFPLVFGLIYAAGKVMDYYFRAQAAGRATTARGAREVFEHARTEGEAEGRRVQAQRARAAAAEPVAKEPVKKKPAAKKPAAKKPAAKKPAAKKPAAKKPAAKKPAAKKPAAKKPAAKKPAAKKPAAKKPSDGSR